MDNPSPPSGPRTYELFGKQVKYDPGCPFPSDELPELRKHGMALGAPVRVLEPVRLLLDANRALTTIWRKAGYAKVENRTPLEEAVAAGVVRVFAPPELLRELDDEHLGRCPPSKKREPPPLTSMQEARRLLLESIEIVEPPGITSPDIERLRARDPKDVAYAQLFEHLKLDAVLSQDGDWKATGYPVVQTRDHDLFATLRKYARAATEEIGRYNVLTAGTVLAVEAVKGAWELLGRAPPVLGWLGRAALVATAFHPGLHRAVLPKVAEFYGQLQARSQERAQAQQLIERDIQPNPRRLSLKEHARRVLVKAGEPLELSELVLRVLATGASSRSKDLGAYLRRQMLGDKRFVEHAGGRWSSNEPSAWSELSPGIRSHVLFTQGLVQGWHKRQGVSGADAQASRA